MQNNSLNNKDLDKFISAIEKIFEHTSNILGEANKKVKEEHYLHLIKMVTFELVFDSKKELKIELFRGIDNLLYANGIPKGSDIRTFLEHWDRIHKLNGYNI